MKRRILEVGKSFGRWTILYGPVIRKSRPYYRVCCSCGTEKFVIVYTLANGTSLSCGCFTRERILATHTTHGESKRHRLYRLWQGMLARCYNRKRREYCRYGGRGIFVCQEWQTNYIAFRDWALMSGYTLTATLDRQDNDGAYTPTNCRWVDRIIQANNKTTSKQLIAFGETKTMAQWLKDPRCIVGYGTLGQRLRLGWSVETALTLTPLRRHPRDITAFGTTKNMSEWSRDARCVVGRRALERRLKKHWSPELALTTTPVADAITGVQ